mmetsp:Transcript_3744/g.7654  ORF Transcript_3744/g.7654 Transcript_3744/m.7654 type:complete len:176 (+) Transcript_3744:113-640(+)
MFSIKIIATMTTGIPQQLQPKRESICLLAISNNNTMPDTRNSNTKKGKQVYHILYNTLKAVNTSTLYPLCETHGEKVSSCVLHYPDPVSFATTQIKYILSCFDSGELINLLTNTRPPHPPHATPNSIAPLTGTTLMSCDHICRIPPSVSRNTYTLMNSWIVYSAFLFPRNERKIL